MYNVDLKKLATGLLPFSLRGSVKELLYALLHPVKALHHRFSVFRGESLWRMKYNSCVGSMQAMLNDRFADILNSESQALQILIGDGEPVPTILVYPNEEQEPVMVGMVMLTSHRRWGAVPFVVRIPIEFEGDENLRNAVEKLVKQYKLAGTKYTVEYY